jgi:hypothetical protein
VANLYFIVNIYCGKEAKASKSNRFMGWPHKKHARYCNKLKVFVKGNFKIDKMDHTLQLKLDTLTLPRFVMWLNAQTKEYICKRDSLTKI